MQASFLNAVGYPGAIRIIISARFPVEKMATQTFPLRDAFETMRVAREAHDTALKVVLTPEEPARYRRTQTDANRRLTLDRPASILPIVGRLLSVGHFWRARRVY